MGRMNETLMTCDWACGVPGSTLGKRQPLAEHDDSQDGYRHLREVIFHKLPSGVAPPSK